MQNIEEFLAALRADLHELSSLRLPLAVTKKRAAFELSVSPRKLDAMISAGQIQTCLVGKTKMVPRDELLRIVGTKKSAVPAPRTSGRKARAPKVDARSEAEKARAMLKAAQKRR